MQLHKKIQSLSHKKLLAVLMLCIGLTMGAFLALHTQSIKANQACIGDGCMGEPSPKPVENATGNNTTISNPEPTQASPDAPEPTQSQSPAPTASQNTTTPSLIGNDTVDNSSSPCNN